MVFRWFSLLSFPKILFNVLLIIFIFSFSNVNGQVHSVPPNGEKGVPGSIQNSFIIGWKGVEEAIGYEYVLSDNPLCFTGCSGDTREAFTTDTFTVEYNLQDDVWYYWITRIVYESGDTSQWTLISSFLASNPEDTDAKMVSVAPNPIVYPNLSLRFDWALNPKANQVSILLYDLNGTVRRNLEFDRSFALRFEEVYIPVTELPSGIYIMIATVNGNQNNTNNQFTIRIIVP